MNGIQVKSYLFPDNSKVSLNTLSQVDEIRRFNLSVDPSQVGSYKSLTEKIQLAYGFNEKDEIRTYWQDDENELIGFTSDQELQYAIDVLTAMKMSKPYDNTNKQTCLFKVYVAKKASNTGKGPQCPRMNFQRGHHQGPRTHFGVVCDNCEGQVIGNRYKCLTCVDYDLCEECMGKKVHSEHAMDTIATPIRASFLPPFGGARCQRRNGEKRNGNGGGCRQNNPMEHVMKNMWNLPGSIPLVNNPEQLKSFGENLKKFLDPLGIDVSYYVDNMTKEPEVKKEDMEKKSEQKEDMDVTSADRRDDDIEEVVVSKPLNSVHEGLSDVGKSSDQVASAPEEESLIDLAKSMEEPFKEAISVLSSIGASYEAAAAASTGGGMVDGFSLVQIDKELKIIQAIEQLNAMGYTDDGGWLTRLVSAKQGNINAVLDAITPGPKK